jgi:CRP-like cAMP-binding protein
MGIKDILQNIELFNGLMEGELNQVAAICQEMALSEGEVIAVQDETGSELLIITKGLVEILVNDKQEPSHNRVVANLGTAQIIGEMGLVDQGTSFSHSAFNSPTNRCAGDPLWRFFDIMRE